MEINAENNTIVLTERDLNYILPNFVKAYKFRMRNNLPTKIIFSNVQHLTYIEPGMPAAINIPLEYEAAEEPVIKAEEIEVVMKHEIEADEKFPNIKPVEPRKSPFDSLGKPREPKPISNPVGPGVSADGATAPRLPGDLRSVAEDLRQES